jgi:NAD+ kinase
MIKHLGILRASDRDSVKKLEADLAGRLNDYGISALRFNLDSEIPKTLELLLVLGGDGTILSAVERIFGMDCKILGVNLGRVGFLAEAEPSDVDSIVEAVVQGSLSTEERVALKIEIFRSGKELVSGFALNEIAIEKIDRSMMVELNVRVDADALMAWSGDGLIVATATGSTAYAFSAGGPIIWPTADVIEVVPIAAHALFSRPIVLDPSASVEVQVISDVAFASMDGRRSVDLLIGDVIKITRASQKVKFARISTRTFTNRLVEKFRLPVSSWRDNA